MTERSAPLRNFPFTTPAELEMEPLFARLREEEPISQVRLPHGGNAWLVTRYADVKAVLGDPRFGRAATVNDAAPRIQPDPAGEGVLMSLDPPDHTRLRRTLAGAFTRRRVEELRPATRALAEGLVDAMEAAGAPADLVTAYALPLPVAVVCDLLGVPEDARDRLRTWSDALLSTTACTPDESAAAARSMSDYFTDLIGRRRERPTDDLLSALIRIRDQENTSPRDEELALLTRDLLVAGHETTASQIANCAYLLMRWPEAADRLRAAPELTAQAVEELLRYVPLGSGSFRARVATEAVTVCGVRIEAGETVFAPTVSANRDPEVFADPDDLVLDRSPNPHLAFGHGVHHCLGAQLARLELQVALEVLLRRAPGLRLAVCPEDLNWRTGMQIRGPQKLPVQW